MVLGRMEIGGENIYTYPTNFYMTSSGFETSFLSYPGSRYISFFLHGTMSPNPYNNK